MRKPNMIITITIIITNTNNDTAIITITISHFHRSNDLKRRITNEKSVAKTGKINKKRMMR
jgi:hypothetical protein